VILGASRVMQDSQYQRLCPFILNRGFSGTAWWLPMWGHPTVCLGLLCKVLNQLVVGLSALSETTSPTCMISLMMELGEYLCLINCIA
jgi:hypothetical protein